jgi:hypothetical protein
MDEKEVSNPERVRTPFKIRRAGIRSQRPVGGAILTQEGAGIRSLRPVGGAILTQQGAGIRSLRPIGGVILTQQGKLVPC